MKPYSIFLLLGLGGTAISIPLISEEKTYLIFSIIVAIILLILGLAFELYIRLKPPILANRYTLYLTFSELSVGLLFYYIAIIAVACVNPYSWFVKAGHLILTSIGFGGTLWYFRYYHYPRLFREKDGFQFGIQKKILDPDNGCFDISSKWTHAFATNKNRTKKQHNNFEKYSWLYPLASAFGIVAVHLCDFERIQMLSFTGIAFAIIAILFAWIASLSLHDHALVRHWEKEHGKLLQAK